ncbi:hypothetical protein OAS95_04520 [Pelagibacteraceae bacterium]|nr:hypothetical protein [Pelagibacteraceae bacterium]
MPMRKMMSIVFLLLVLIISLGVSGYMNSVNSLKEGLDEEPPTPEGEELPATEGEEPPSTEGEEPPATEGEESTFDVTPMEGACAETMTNYK